MPRDASPIRLYLFDADDTLRRTRVPRQPSPRAPGEWELLPGVAARLRAMPWGPHDLLLGVASNQDQVGYGLVTVRAAHQLLMDMIQAATGIAPPAEAVTLCPHRLETPCACRKPAAGMLLRIMTFYGVSPEETLFVGNAPTDHEAARRAGTRFAWARDFFALAEERR
ncbi:MAG: HAD-IIIA family hydrolase [Gemmatimonadaceae bacterium]|nr:HAD-IIIA family hydrolase [Gemmatimonadaceae bacterium]